MTVHELAGLLGSSEATARRRLKAWQANRSTLSRKFLRVLLPQRGMSSQHGVSTLCSAVGQLAEMYALMSGNYS